MVKVAFAPIVGDYITIEEDRTDRPLVERLVAAGIPREKIVCPYACDPYPDVQSA
ncbi:MAG: XisI protein [Anaerolineae bacterium]|nr:MAG: XisI protein [Anaerolineae bacterium]